MATMFGRFEVQSELSKSETALIYKVMDTEANQVVALKTQSLAPLGKRADAFVETLIREGESTRDLAFQNIVSLFGAGEIEGQFCAAMEYIQGNSIGSMLARKEGFSIWDLLDITRQLCAGLEHAASKNVTHCSLEPAKVMVQWDGTVKILGYGISNMSLIEAESGKSLGRLMPYCSPEQIRGEAIDLRSNLFTLGAILYEMVAGQKAFDATDPVALLSQIENEMPAPPSSVNSKIQPGVSTLIMHALAKDPAERYQTARELLEELEQCKESGKKAVPDSAKSSPTRSAVVTSTASPTAASRFVSAVARPSLEARAVAAPNPGAAASARVEVPAGGGPTRTEARSMSGAMTASAPARAPSAIAAANSSSNGPKSKSGAGAIEDFDARSREYQAARAAALSAPPPEEEPARREPKVAVDPLMAAPAVASSGKSFSDLAEMPPLTEPVFAPSVQDTVENPFYETQNVPAKRPGKKEEKLKILPREVAENAIREIVTIPPRLILYSFLGAVLLILVILSALFFHVRSEDEDSTVASHPLKTEPVIPAPTPPQPQVQTPVPPPQIERPVPAVVEVQPNLQIRQVKKASSKASRRAPAPAPVAVVIPGEVLVDSTPEGAQFQVDEKSDPSWVTPFTLTGLNPGKHVVVLNKSGYSPETRSVEVFERTRSSLALHLYPVTASMVVNSTPGGASIIVDGKPTGRATPAQFAVEKGSHTVLLRKQGYLDETVTADLSPAQNFQYSPQLRALGDTTDMRTVGKLSKLFGRGENTAGMGSISIRTQPKGAQVAINQSVLEKTSPVGVMLGPGNYIVDITLTGFKPVHKVVSLDKGDKMVVDQILDRQ